MDKPRIAILMSTYNGEKFITEQIDSLMDQTYMEWTLYVRDDGSTDGTVNMLMKYQNTFKNIVFLEDKQNLGACESFMKLLKSVDAEYYMFCDQDDVWLPNKVERTLYEMQRAESECNHAPVAICTDLTLVDSDLKVIEPSMWRFSGLYPQYLKDWKCLQVCNIFTGCTMMINQAAKYLCMKDSSKANMHDSWIGLNVAANGGCIAPIEDPLILYRQHSTNVLGCPPEPSLSYYWNKIKSVSNLFKGMYSQYKVVNSVKKTSLLSFYFHKLKYQLIRLRAK